MRPQGDTAMPYKTPEAQVERLAVQVASGMSVCAASRKLGISERAGKRWSAKPEFQSTVEAIRKQVISQAVGTLTAGAVKASRTLVELLHKSKSDDVRLRAAKQILEGLLVIREGTELLDRLVELEARLAPPPPEPWADGRANGHADGYASEVR
jgi:hypothetical protein